jgi:hypothetical protein
MGYMGCPKSQGRDFFFFFGWADHLALLILGCPQSETLKNMVGLWFQPKGPGIIRPAPKMYFLRAEQCRFMASATVHHD